jgi:hypothetical protein
MLASDLRAKDLLKKSLEPAAIMTLSTPLSLRSVLLSSLSSVLLFQNAAAHVEMSQPFPMRSRLDPQVPENLKDYNLKSPLDPSGSTFPCFGYQNDHPIHTTATYQPGGTYQMSFSGTATHGKRVPNAESRYLAQASLTGFK